MDTEPDHGLEFWWATLRRHPAFRFAAIYVGASWVLLQATEVLGIATTTIRLLAALLAGGLVVGLGVGWLAARRRADEEGSASLAAAAPPFLRTMPTGWWLLGILVALAAPERRSGGSGPAWATNRWPRAPT